MHSTFNYGPSIFSLFLDNGKHPASNLVIEGASVQNYYIVKNSKHIMVHHYWLMRKINGQSWDAKNSTDLDSRPWHALTISSFLSSVRCNRTRNCQFSNNWIKIQSFRFISTNRKVKQSYRTLLVTVRILSLNCWDIFLI